MGPFTAWPCDLSRGRLTPRFLYVEYKSVIYGLDPSILDYGDEDHFAASCCSYAAGMALGPRSGDDCLLSARLCFHAALLTFWKV